jgi:hypothetical protein
MDADETVVYRSKDNRLRTSKYKAASSEAFCVAEKTREGVLLSEFNSDGEILNQHYVKEKDHLARLISYLKLPEPVSVKEVDAYERVAVKAKCSKCSSASLVRQLDLVDPMSIADVPVVPMYICLKCSERHYSITDTYLRRLARMNTTLFSKEELAEMSKDEDSFVKQLYEYIIRIFASKKINRIKTA